MASTQRPTSSTPTSTAAALPKPYILQVQPVDLSLTAGTNIPAPVDSPPPSPIPKSKSRPPTSGGGPLTSHPAIESMPGAFPPTPEPEKAAPLTTNMSSETNRNTIDSFQTPTSPVSDLKNNHDGLDNSPRARRPSGVRRLFSLTNLRQSFNSSRTSISMARPSSSYPESSYGNSQYTTNSQVPSYDSTAEPPVRPNTALRKKRSSNWFKRKSGMFTMNDEGYLDIVTED